MINTRQNTVKKTELSSRSFLFKVFVDSLNSFGKERKFGRKGSLLSQLPETLTTCIYGGFGWMNIRLKTLEKIFKEFSRSFL